MAKVYKITAYLTDYNDEYSYTDFKHEIVQKLHDFGIGVDIVDVQGSKEFEFDDDLTINMTYATEEDFEKYFEKKAIYEVQLYTVQVGTTTLAKSKLLNTVHIELYDDATEEEVIAKYKEDFSIPRTPHTFLVTKIDY